MSDDEQKPLRMNAYYYGFDLTGVRAIDEILSAVACAGKAYHLTEDWTEHNHETEPSEAEKIQAAAERAAREVERLMPIAAAAARAKLGLGERVKEKP